MRTNLLRLVLLGCLALLAVLVLVGCSGGRSWGPATGRIAFTSERDENSEIYVMEADGSGQTNLTSDPSGDEEPFWSPDGSRLAFSTRRKQQVDIYTMASDGSDVQQFTNSPAVKGFLRWSPDGSKVTFYSFEQPDEGYLWVFDLETAEGRPLLAGIHPAGLEAICAGGFPGNWLPDSETVVFRGYNAESAAAQICSVKADGSDLKVLYTEPNTNNVNPSASRDGKKIVFMSDRDGNNEIYTVDADGSDRRRLTEDEANDDYPTWSPDGDWIAFASDRDGDFEIYIMRPDGSDLRQLTDNTFADIQPTWTP